jgi:hypothetical protein
MAVGGNDAYRLPTRGVYRLPDSAVWNGGSWRELLNPAKGGDLKAVSCANPTSCWAVGFEHAAKSTSRVGAVAEHWNGTSWRAIRVPLHA